MPRMKTIASLNDLNFHHTLATLEGVALVVFTAPHCGACRHLKQALKLLQQQQPELSLFEVDAVHNGGLVNELEVFHLPALFLYVNGRFHRQLHCEPFAHRIQQALELALRLPAEEEP